VVPSCGVRGSILPGLRAETAVTASGRTDAAAGAARTNQGVRGGEGGQGMSAVPVTPLVIHDARAVAETELPQARPKPIPGLVFYRKHTLALLQRYLQLSMELGRAPCVLGKIVLRGHVSSYRLRTFEDGLIFLLDVEKCIQRLDKVSREIIVHIALEDYSVIQAVVLTGHSQRSVTRIYGDAMDRLTRLFMRFGLLEANVENLSRDEGKIQSNDTR
jgi:hypothetical protein